ncbi:hypothetical protein YPPY91_2491, partial [Yersinia pestis PY-91]
MRQRLA